MYDLLLAGLADMMQVKYLVPLVLGTLVGVIGGALPGVTITLTIIVALPFTFGLDPFRRFTPRAHLRNRLPGRRPAARIC